ncbi:hypothetical protein [Burkholderia anthina]|uniref:hypothetical protein n=1 Tax=Burkholderia anthina TaxID=179879 RepID=UPI00158AD7BA|nr:hypothetical protein [Burkholderia anthina]
MKIRNIVCALLMSCTSFAFVAAANAQGDSSYPEVSPLYRHQVAQQRVKQAQDTGMGPQMDGSTQSGARATPPAAAHPSTDTHDACVGPASFCNIYFGS